MTRTITINLNGIAFSIDEDAYNLLQSYLRHVEANLSNLSDKAEVMRDIEARIAELLAAMPDVETLNLTNGKSYIQDILDSYDKNSEEYARLAKWVA